MDIDAGLLSRLDERVAAEERTLRRVVEWAIAYYMDRVPIEQFPTPSAPPRRGQTKPKK